MIPENWKNMNWIKCKSGNENFDAFKAKGIYAGENVTWSKSVDKRTNAVRFPCFTYDNATLG